MHPNANPAPVALVQANDLDRKAGTGAEGSAASSEMTNIAKAIQQAGYACEGTAKHLQRA